jgi:PadR family transcriptional regulator PadR
VHNAMLMKIENIKSQMRKGVLELCVLSIIKDKESYPSEIIERLKDNRLIIVEGTLYPMLTRMKNANILSYRWEESKSGPPRKYYCITTQGEELLYTLEETWAKLSSAVNNVNKSSKTLKLK